MTRVKLNRQYVWHVRTNLRHMMLSDQIKILTSLGVYGFEVEEMPADEARPWCWNYTIRHNNRHGLMLFQIARPEYADLLEVTWCNYE